MTIKFDHMEVGISAEVLNRTLPIPPTRQYIDANEKARAPLNKAISELGNAVVTFANHFDAQIILPAHAGGKKYLIKGGSLRNDTMTVSLEGSGTLAPIVCTANSGGSYGSTNASEAFAALLRMATSNNPFLAMMGRTDVSALSPAPSA